MEILKRKIVGALGGLSKSCKYDLKRDPAKDQLKSINDLIELVKKLDLSSSQKKEILRKLWGAKGGLTKSINNNLNRDPACGQKKLFYDLLKIVSKR